MPRRGAGVGEEKFGEAGLLSTQMIAQTNNKNTKTVEISLLTNGCDCIITASIRVPDRFHSTQAMRTEILQQVVLGKS